LITAALRRVRWLGLALLVCAVAPPATAQSLNVRVVGDQLHLRGTSLGLIEGQVSEHLKDGRSVRVDVELTILDSPRGTAITQSRQTFTLSFDLWEQRFAVTRAGPPPRSISHLTARDAEAWCLDNMTVPLAALGRFSREAPLWIRVDYRVQDPTPAPNPEDDSTFTLRTLIERLSRRRQDEALGRTLEAGPFRVRQP
jgi:hypothetical protein